MTNLRIRLTKKHDNSTVLSCFRSDGTSTGQRSRGEFFPLHDLAHYAVETTLGLRSGFYGILARGWDISDFGTPWPRGPLPDDAIEDAGLAESIVGMLDMERTTGVRVDAAEVNGWLAQGFEKAGLPLRRPLTEEQLAQIRTRFADLRKRWEALPPGNSLELLFPLRAYPPET